MDIGGYKLNHPEEIETPAMLVYEDLVQHNIREIMRICGSPQRVVPHFKTHKSAAVLKLQMQAGISALKVSTVKEAEVLAENGVKEIIVAYPIPHRKKLERLMALKKLYPGADIKVIASTPEHLNVMSQAATAHKQRLGVYLDLDPGMHRTGVQPGEEAGRFYARIARTPGLKPSGIHCYDGSVGGSAEPEPRKVVVQKNLEHIHDTIDRARRQGLDVPDVVAGGSWSFSFYVADEDVRVSPGKWIYWDLMNAVMTDLNFKMAAVVLGQVVDRNVGQDTVTVDLGVKGISDDPPTPRRFKVVGNEAMELVSQSEEHGVVKRNGANLGVGDFFLARPGHVCSTTVKYPYALVINRQGDVTGRYDHQARDRE
ncbi:MAG: alanine racemase [Chloroflexi bacterium]|nr:alanine racemase [Chloroflexota bacterium]